jgi:hypothetical protein
LEQTGSALNRLEMQVTERWLSSATRFVVDPKLYALYQRVASEDSVVLAKELCEGHVPPAQLARQKGLPAQQVHAVLRDLLRRRVIEFVRDA